MTELNQRHNLATIPAINNNGESYIVPFDIYKEGYEAYDISNWFKARVGDNGTPFGVRWYAHGRVLNVLGYRPFIEGEVGDYTIDDTTDPDNPKIVMEPDASHIHLVGDIDDCQEGGIAIYRLVDQAIPKSGIFYGKIGFMGTQDNDTTVMSSVDVMFKVLAGHMNMIGARKFYVSELEKALIEFQAKIKKHNQDFQDQTKQVIDDARNTYESETKNAHDALDALTSQIQANRDEQENLSQHLAGTEQQMEIHDVVTRPEFNSLSNQLTQQVSQMREAGLEFFQNADDLKAKYPNGANKLCVTLDDSHQYVYDYANNQWNDAGAFNYGTIDPKLLQAVYSKAPDNVIPNSEFYTTDLWTIGRDATSGTSPDYYIENTKNGNALVMNGFAKDGSTDESFAITDMFPVGDSKYASFGVQIAMRDIDYTDGRTARLQFTFGDANGNLTYYNRIVPANLQDGNYHEFIANHITYPTGTTTIGFGVTFYGNGQVKFRNPQANFDYMLKPYSAGDLENRLKATDDDLLISQPIKNWDQIAYNSDFSINFDTDNFSTNSNGSVTLNPVLANTSGYDVLISDFIKVDSSNKLDATVTVQNVNNALGLTYFQIQQYKDKDSDTKLPNTDITKYFTNSDHRKFHFGNLVLDPLTRYIQVSISTSGKSKLTVNDVKLRVVDSLTRALQSKLQKSDILAGIPITDWLPGDVGNGVLNVSSDTTSIYNSQPTIKITSNVADHKDRFLQTENIPVNLADTISFKAILQSKIAESNGNTAHIQISQLNKNGVTAHTNDLNFYLSNTDGFRTYIFNNLDLDPTTKFIQIFLVISGAATINIADIECKLNQSFKTDDPENLIANHGFFMEFPFPEPTVKNCLLSIETRNKTKNDNTFITSNKIHVKPGSIVQSAISAKAAPIGDSSKIVLEIRQYSEQYSAIDYSKDLDNYLPDTQGKNQTFTFTNKLRDDTKYIDFILDVRGNGNLDADLSSFKVDYFGALNNDTRQLALPQLNINGDESLINADWHNASFSYNDGSQKIQGYLQFSIQGDSSRGFPKKNLKIKLFSDSECKNKLKLKPKSNWTANNKFNLKANWIDATQARNLANAHIVESAYKNTPIADATVQSKLLNTQSLGQMEGFPIELYFNGSYYGLMTFNTKKDERAFGMDSKNNGEECVTIEKPTSNLDKPTVTIDGQNYATEIQDKASDELNSNWTKFLTFINTSTNTDFKAHIGDYVDIKSVINLLLFGVWSHEWDFYNKSELFLTWNGGKYFFVIPYDLDSTWNMLYDGSKLADNLTDLSWINSSNNTNKLLNRIYDNFKPEIKAQWQYLRSSVWRNDQAISAFKKFINSIPESAYKRDQAKWPAIPSLKLTNFAQIQQAIIERGNAMDKLMDNLVPTVDPIENLQNQINQ